MDVAYEYKRALQGAYRAFFRAGLHVEILDSRSAGRLAEGFRLAYLPCPYMVGEELAAKLLEFARAGGTLVFEAGLGLREENTWMKPDAPGGELAALGFRLKRHFRLRDGEVALELDLLEGRELRVAGNLDRLEVAGEGAARVAGRFRTRHFSLDEESPAALDVPHTCVEGRRRR